MDTSEALDVFNKFVIAMHQWESKYSPELTPVLTQELKGEMKQALEDVFLKFCSEKSKTHSLIPFWLKLPYYPIPEYLPSAEIIKIEVGSKVEIYTEFDDLNYAKYRLQYKKQRWIVYDRALISTATFSRK